MLSDDDCFHTHPWRGFISFILWGGYYEHTPGTSYGGYTAYHLSKKWYYGPMSLLWRPGQFPHKLELKDGKPALTLVVTFKKVREWGFYTRIGKWIHWKEYIRSGAKCE